MYLNDLFMFMEETEICNYADDTTIYASGPSIENVIMNLENDALKITEWFPNNGIKLNEDKCHLMIVGAKRNIKTTVKIGEAFVKESTEENLLGITFDQSLSFKQQVKALCKKTGQNSMLAKEIIVHRNKVQCSAVQKKVRFIFKSSIASTHRARTLKILMYEISFFILSIFTHQVLSAN